jgi:hypothetical protein
MTPDNPFNPMNVSDPRRQVSECYLLAFPISRNAETMELARGIEPSTCGLQKPNEAIPSDQESPDKTDESLEGSGE